MISPSFQWQKWGELEHENRSRFTQAMGITARECEIDDLAGFMTIGETNWLDAKDAFLNASASALSITRSLLEQEAVAGRIQWRESRQQLGIFEVTRGSGIFRIMSARWCADRETFADYIKSIQAAAASQP